MIAVVAAADHAGLAAPRLRSTHLRGSTALAYEPDAIIILNDASGPQGFAGDRGRSVVFSIEKNRDGATDVDLEFVTDFSHYRFHPTGRSPRVGRDGIPRIALTERRSEPRG